MSMKLVFRASTEDDLNMMEKIQKAAYTHPWDKNHLLASIEGDNMHARVLEVRKGDKNVVVGSCLFQKLASELYLVDMVIAPKLQRKGLGRFMMNKVKGLLDKNRTKLSLVVHERNEDAIKFLVSQGFKGIGVCWNAYEDGDGYEMVYDTVRKDLQTA